MAQLPGKAWMAQLREKAWMAQLPEKAQMAQLPKKAQVARPAAEHIPEASENKEFKLNTSVQICTSDADTRKLHEVGTCKHSVKVRCVSDVLYTSSLSMQ